MVTTLTLADFLLARIAKDEAVAREAMGDDDPEAGLTPDYFIDCCNGVHVHCTPERVLAECEAKRQVVAIHETGPGVDWCVVCVEHDYEDTPWPCPTLRVLALPYADHPDYRPEWRP